MDFQERMQRLNLSNAALAEATGLGKDTIGKLVADRRPSYRTDSVRRVSTALSGLERKVLVSLLGTFPADNLLIEKKMAELKALLSVDPHTEGSEAVMLLPGRDGSTATADLDLFTASLTQAHLLGTVQSFTSTSGVTVLVQPTLYTRPIGDALHYLHDCLHGKLVVASAKVAI